MSVLRRRNASVTRRRAGGLLRVNGPSCCGGQKSGADEKPRRINHLDCNFVWTRSLRNGKRRGISNGWTASLESRNNGNNANTVAKQCRLDVGKLAANSAGGR